MLSGLYLSNRVRRPCALLLSHGLHQGGEIEGGGGGGGDQRGEEGRGLSPDGSEPKHGRTKSCTLPPRLGGGRRRRTVFREDKLRLKPPRGTRSSVCCCRCRRCCCRDPGQHRHGAGEHRGQHGAAESTGRRRWKQKRKEQEVEADAAVSPHQSV
ncbi:hypothetical protein INR49_009582 [Caranx melampygus]|nr:hypothetical protein INR49_009582 [Caranx melampygus]